MPLKIYKRGEIWHYRGTVAGRRLRGTAQTADKKRAQQIAAAIEQREWESSHYGPESVLTFADAVGLGTIFHMPRLLKPFIIVVRHALVPLRADLRYSIACEAKQKRPNQPSDPERKIIA